MKFATGLLLALLLALPLPAAAVELRLVGAGPAGGLDFAVAGALQRLFNRGEGEHGLAFGVEATSGADSVRGGLESGRHALGLMRADQQPPKGAKPLMSLHRTAIALLVRADSPIQAPADLAGKRVALASPDDRIFAAILAGSGLSVQSLAAVRRIEWRQAAATLCGNDVDLLAITVFHPQAAVQEAALSCPLRAIPVPDALATAVTAADKSIARATVPAGLYRGIDQPVPSLGVPVLLLAGPDMPEPRVYDLVKLVFESFDDFRRQHPSLAGLSPEQAAATAGLPAHPGAAAYFKAVGLQR